MASKLAVPQPLKWPGGKGYLAKKIVPLFPPKGAGPYQYVHYVEPYFGGGAVLLENDPEGISEVVSEINGNLTNFWHMLKSLDYFHLMLRQLEASPFSEGEWKEAKKRQGQLCNSRACWENAADFFICCRQSLAGRMGAFTGITKTRTRRGMNNEVSAWLSAVEGLPLVHARLKRVLILNRPALEVIEKHEGSNTLYYLDPPYLHETRNTTSEYGPYEMKVKDHQDLLDLLSETKGMFCLSGYRSKLYDEYAKRYCWNRTDFAIANHASGSKNKRRMVECVWRNFE